MSYLAQLKEKIGNSNPQTGTDKTAKSPSVSSVSTDSVILAGNSRPSATTSASPRVELMGLIKAVGTLYAFTPSEFEEATQVAFADPQTALTSFRDIAKRYGLFAPTDDRVTCRECSRLVGGRCGAAKQGLMANTQPDYSPVQDVPRHCEHFRRAKYAN